MLGELKFSPYLRGVGIKYWYNPIIIRERESFGELLEYTFLSILLVY
jgi:hypothetical protein